MFESKYEITFDKLDDLIVPPQLDSNMQIVCNYLKLYDEGKLGELP